MKAKILCVFISILIFFGQSLPAEAASASYDEALFEGRFNCLERLGIITESVRGKAYDERVTYREFSDMLSVICAGCDYASKYIGDSEAVLYSYVDYANAALVLTNLLGMEVLNANSSPAVNAAKADIDDYVVNKDESFNLYDLVMMLCNSLKAEVYEQTVYGEKIKYEKSGKTLSELYMNVHFFEGRLTANKYTSITDGETTAGNRVVVADDENSEITADDGNIDTYDLIGRHVEGFYSGKTALNRGNVLLCIRESEASRSLKIDYENKPYYADGKIEYYDASGRLKSVKLDYDSVLVYNGQAVSDNTSEVLNLINDSGDSVLCDIVLSGDGGSSYDTVSICTYKNVVVSSVSKIYFKASGLNDTFISYDDEYRNGLVRLTDTEGNALLLKDVNEGDTLSVREGLSSDRAVSITACSDSFSGTIKSLNLSGQNPSVVIDVFSEDGTSASECEYFFAGEKAADGLIAGNSYTFYFDFTGRIAHAEPSDDGAEHTGLFVRIGSDGEHGLRGSELKLMLMPLLEDDTPHDAQVVYLSDNAKFENEKITSDSASEINKRLFHTIIKYRLNSSGEVSRITEADNSAYGTMQSRNRPATLQSEDEKPEISELTFIMGQNAMFIKDDTSVKGGAPFTSITFATYTSAGMLKPLNGVKVICVPDISPSEAGPALADDYYKIADIGQNEFFSSMNPGNTKVTAYYEDGDPLPSYIVYTMSADEKPEDYKAFAYSNNIILVNDVKTVINPYTGLECLEISGMYGGEEREVYTRHAGVLNYAADGEYIDVGEGDLLLVVFDANGLVTYGIKYYDFDPESLTGGITEEIDGRYGLYCGADGVDEYFSRAFAYEGYVYKEGANNIGFMLADSVEAMESDGESGSLLGFGAPLRNIYVYDTTLREPENRVSSGTTVSGVTYFEDGAHPSYAVVRQRSGQCIDAVIYK